MDELETPAKLSRYGYRPNAGRPKGAKAKRPRNPRERAVYAAARIEQILDDAREGMIELTPARLKAIEIAYSRLKPTLAAVEHTEPNPRDKITPGELVARLAAMFDARPELFEQVQALRHASVTPANDSEIKPEASAA